MTELIQNLLDNEATPIVTAFLLGLLTAISPCPLATNIAAVGFIGKNIENKWTVLMNGLLYTLGRILSYSVLGLVLIVVLKQGSGIFKVQKFFATYGGKLIGPLLLSIGLFMLFGHKLNLPKFGYSSDGEKLARRGGLGALMLGMLFALAFCPTSVVLYFSGLIPLSVASSGGFLLPVIFAVATALPVLAVAFIVAFGIESIGRFYGKMQVFQKWMNLVVGSLFILIGVYYIVMFI